MRRKKLAEGKKRYAVGAVITISIHTEVIASSPEEARELAMAKPIMGLCHQCSGGEPDLEWVTSGELDGGEPQPYEGESEFDVQEL